MVNGSSATRSSEPRPTVVWVERLTLPTLVWLRLESLLTAAEIRYDERQVTPAARGALERLTKAGLGFGLHPAGLTLARQDASGSALNYRREDELDRLVDAFCRRRMAERPLWYRRAFKSYLCDYLMFRVTFIVMVEAAAADRPAADNVLYLTRHPANGLVTGHDAWRGFRFRQSLAPRGILRAVGAPLALFCRLALALFRTPPRAPGLDEDRPAVWVEFDRSDLGRVVSRTFWRGQVDAKGFDLVYYLDRRDAFCDAETTAAIEAQGFRWIDCHAPWSLARLSADDLADALRAFATAGPGAPVWLRFFDLEFVLLERMWAAVFSRFRTRLLVQHQEFSWRQAPQARGLERAGGRMIGFHWSEFQFTTEPIHLNPEHLFFVWGRSNRGWLEAKGNDCENILPCGVWIPVEDRVTASIRERLAGADFTLALFDSSYDYNIFLSGGQLSDFLLAMLGLLDEHPRWKAVLKPKALARYAALPRGAEILDAVERLVRKGRLIALEPDLTPPTAALATDLSACFGLNSAGVVSGALGARAVHWDCSGWTRHPLKADPGQKVVYPTLDALKDAVLAAAAGDRSVGDFSRWRAAINHFDDRLAARRVGGWINGYMLKRGAGLGAAEALREAVSDYRREHGVDASFEAPDSWWKTDAANERIQAR